jgi:hypothetical protein
MELEPIHLSILEQVEKVGTLEYSEIRWPDWTAKNAAAEWLAKEGYLREFKYRVPWDSDGIGIRYSRTDKPIE